MQAVPAAQVMIDSWLTYGAGPIIGFLNTMHPQLTVLITVNFDGNMSEL